MRLIVVTVIFAAIFSGLCFVASKTVAIQVSDKILSDVGIQLISNDLTDVVAQADGRDITLAGELVSQAQIDKAMEVIHSRPGVRLVVNDMVLKGVTSQSAEK